MKIAVYSGSFNPLHKGHEAIIRFLTQKAGFDWVYLVVTPQNPFKDAHSLPAGQDRYDAAQSAIARHPDLKVTLQDIELKMTPPQYTIRTLDALRAREPENDFTLVIGADNLACFLMKEDPSYRITLLKAPLVTISSTEIREGLAAGRDMSRWLM